MAVEADCCPLHQKGWPRFELILEIQGLLNPGLVVSPKQTELLSTLFALLSPLPQADPILTLRLLTPAWARSPALPELET